jgi:hypothetical protein
MNSVVFSPSKIRYEPCYSSESNYDTPHLYEEGTNKDKSLYQSQSHNNHDYESGRYEEDQEDDQDDDTENNPGIRTARSERGLKRLSVKVRDLVYKLKETSYKDVANKLIDELVTDNEYDDYGNRLDRKSTNDRKTKEEKNVRRRVYDALNVLIASGVLKKNVNKNVMFEERPESRMKGLKLVVRNKHENKKRQLAKLIYLKKKDIQNKKKAAEESMKKLSAIKQLISRNKVKEIKEQYNSNFINHEMSVKAHEDRMASSQSSNVAMNEVVEKIRFPMLILGTENSSSNKINI